MKLVFQQKLNRKLVNSLPPISSSKHDPRTRPRCYSARISVSIPESLKDCVAIVISSQRREIFSSHVAENARSLAPLEVTSMWHSCIATQSLNKW
jgi:hypothetical protein